MNDTIHDAPASQPSVPDEKRAFRDDLFRHGHLISTGIDGVYGQGPEFAGIVSGLDRAISMLNSGATVMRFPPVLAQATLERCGYMHSFPHLAGSVYAFDGDVAQHARLVERLEEGRPYADALSMTGLALAPTACYAVYGQFQGTLPNEGIEVDVENLCFRREPSEDPSRLQAFRMREYVRLGAPDAVRTWRDAWIERGLAFLHDLGLPAASAPANDPFFGAPARVLAAQQRALELKWELLAPAGSVRKPTPVMSCNYHLDHFGSEFKISLPDGSVAHSACVGFGMERIALALLHQHGMDVPAWPAGVQSSLDLDSRRRMGV